MTFSSDSELMIIETDHFNPIIIINLVSFQVVHNISVLKIIKRAYFLDSTNTLVAIICSDAFIIADLSNNQLYAMPPFTATSYSADQNSSLFTCYNN